MAGFPTWYEESIMKNGWQAIPDCRYCHNTGQIDVSISVAKLVPCTECQRGIGTQVLEPARTSATTVSGCQNCLMYCQYHKQPPRPIKYTCSSGHHVMVTGDIPGHHYRCANCKCSDCVEI